MQSAPDWLHQSKFNHRATLDTAPTSLQDTSCSGLHFLVDKRGSNRSGQAGAVPLDSTVPPPFPASSSPPEKRAQLQQSHTARCKALPEGWVLETISAADAVQWTGHSDPLLWYLTSSSSPLPLQCPLSCSVFQLPLIILWDIPAHRSPPWLPPYTAIRTPLELQMLRGDEVSEELGRKSKDEQALLHSPGSSTARKARGENVLCPAALTAPTLRVTCTQQRLLQPGQELLQGPSSRPTALTSSGDCCGSQGFLSSRTLPLSFFSPNHVILPSF